MELHEKIHKKCGNVSKMLQEIYLQSSLKNYAQPRAKVFLNAEGGHTKYWFVYMW